MMDYSPNKLSTPSSFSILKPPPGSIYGQAQAIPGSSSDSSSIPHLPSEEFELTANSLGAHMKVIESSPGMGQSELILRTFI